VPAAGAGRHGSWYLRLDLPTGPDGRRRRIRRGGYASPRAAVAALAAIRGPDGAEPGRTITTVDWLEHWLASRTSLAASTIRSYAGHVRLYLKPYLGRSCWRICRLPRCKSCSPRSPVTIRCWGRRCRPRRSAGSGPRCGPRSRVNACFTNWLRIAGSTDPERDAPIIANHWTGVVLHQLANPDPAFDPSAQLTALITTIVRPRSAEVPA
jgi:hypothetical protein